MLPKTADIVIIGAGALGSSIAYHLTKRGARDIVVLERESIGSGSTSKAAGGIRVQFATRVEIEFSLRGIAFFKRFEEEMGAPCDFRQEGYLFVLTRERDLERFRKNVALQQSLGADVRIIAPDDARAIVPELRVDDAIAAVWGPMDGYASPNDVVQAYAAQARARGARFVEGTPVTGIEVAGRASPRFRPRRGESRPGLSSMRRDPRHRWSAKWSGSSCPWTLAGATSSSPMPSRRSSTHCRW